MKLVGTSLKVLSLAATVALLANTTLGKNEIYQLGASFGEALRDSDGEEPMDLSDLDYELQQLAEQMGTGAVVDKLMGDEHFTDGVTNAYYQPEIVKNSQKQ